MMRKTRASAKLNERQRVFCREWVKDCCGKDAAIRAGYSPRSAAVTAARLLTDARIQDEIAHLIAARNERLDVEGDEALREAEQLTMRDPREVVKWGPDAVVVVSSDELTPEAARLVASVEQQDTKHGRTVKVKLRDRDALLKLYAELKGELKQRHEVTGKDGEPLQAPGVIYFPVRAQGEAEGKK